MIYTIPYVLVTLLFAICAFIIQREEVKERKRAIEVVCLVVYIVFFGFRGLVGTDWLNYYPFFENCSLDSYTLNLLGEEGHYEPGFTTIVLLSKFLFGSFSMFCFVCCLINTFLLVMFFKRYVDNIALGLLLFMCMGGVQFSINLMRNTIAILIMANALHYIVERKPLRYFSACVLALTFHISTLLFFPLYFFFHKKINKWVYLGFITIGLLLFLSGAKLVTLLLTKLALVYSDKFEFMITAYTEGFDEARTISIGLLERLFTAVLIFCYYDKILGMRKDSVLFVNAFVLYYFFYMYFAEFDIMSMRLATLFTFCYWVIWRDLLRCFSIENNRKLFVAFVGIYAIFKVAGQTRLSCYSYDNCLFGAKSYPERLYLYVDETDS